MTYNYLLNYLFGSLVISKTNTSNSIIYSSNSIYKIDNLKIHLKNLNEVYYLIQGYKPGIFNLHTDLKKSDFKDQFNFNKVFLNGYLEGVIDNKVRKVKRKRGKYEEKYLEIKTNKTPWECLIFHLDYLNLKYQKQSQFYRIRIYPKSFNDLNNKLSLNENTKFIINN